MWGHGEKAAACTPGRDTSEETSPARSLISNPDRLQSPQLVAGVAGRRPSLYFSNFEFQVSSFPAGAGDSGLGDGGGPCKVGVNGVCRGWRTSPRTRNPQGRLPRDGNGRRKEGWRRLWTEHASSATWGVPGLVLPRAWKTHGQARRPAVG